MQKLRPSPTFGDRIRELRLARGMTQLQVIAKMNLMGLDIQQGNYSKIENNRSNIRISELAALQKIFDVEFNDFFAGLNLNEKEQSLYENELR